MIVARKMIGKLHFATAGIFCLPFALALFAGAPQAIELSAVLLLGVLIGVLLPDSDVSEAHIFKSRFKAAGLLTRYALFLPIATILYLVGFKEARLHRGVMHSLVGALAATALWGFIALGVSKYGGIAVGYAIAFTVGIAGGYLLHLFEDSLTAMGVRWLYPKRWLLKGSVSMTYHEPGRKHFLQSQFFTALLFVIAGIANGFAVLFAGMQFAGLTLLSVFELLLIAGVMRVETESG